MSVIENITSECSAPKEPLTDATDTAQGVATEVQPLQLNADTVYRTREYTHACAQTYTH